jgi:hypothetical protein
MPIRVSFLTLTSSLLLATCALGQRASFHAPSFHAPSLGSLRISRAFSPSSRNAFRPARPSRFISRPFRVFSRGRRFNPHYFGRPAPAGSSSLFGSQPFHSFHPPAPSSGSSGFSYHDFAKPAPGSAHAGIQHTRLRLPDGGLAGGSHSSNSGEPASGSPAGRISPLHGSHIAPNPQGSGFSAPAHAGMAPNNAQVFAGSQSWFFPGSFGFPFCPSFFAFNPFFFSSFFFYSSFFSPFMVTPFFNPAFAFYDPLFSVGVLPSAFFDPFYFNPYLGGFNQGVFFSTRGATPASVPLPPDRGAATSPPQQITPRKISPTPIRLQESIGNPARPLVVNLGTHSLLVTSGND